MADWIQCPNCQLNHSIRPDGLCPRCRAAVVSRGWASAPAVAPPPAVPAQGIPPPLGPPAAAEPPRGLPPPPVQAPPARFAPLGYGAAGPDFTVGNFLSAAFSTWGRNLGVILPLVLALAAPVALTLYATYARMPAQPRDLSDFPWEKLGLAMLVGLVAWPLELVAVVRAGARRLRGEQVELGDAFSMALRRFLPALWMTVLVTLANLATACTLAVPLLLLTGWAAAAPALVEEGLGPVESLRRSWALTRGVRWQVFAGFLVLALIVFACACLFQSLATVVVLAATGGFRSGGAAPSGMAGLQAVNALAQAIEQSLLTTATAVAYHQLRAAKEGHAQDHLGQVFE